MVAMLLLTSEAFELKDQFHAANIVVPARHYVSTSFLDQCARSGVDVSNNVLRRPHAEQAAFSSDMIFNIDLQPLCQAIFLCFRVKVWSGAGSELLFYSGPSRNIARQNCMADRPVRGRPAEAVS